MKNKYILKFTVIKLNIKNTDRKRFMENLSNIPLLGYEVETLSDERKIYITKPVGKLHSEILK